MVWARLQTVRVCDCVHLGSFKRFEYVAGNLWEALGGARRWLRRRGSLCVVRVRNGEAMGRNKRCEWHKEHAAKQPNEALQDLVQSLGMKAHDPDVARALN